MSGALERVTRTAAKPAQNERRRVAIRSLESKGLKSAVFTATCIRPVLDPGIVLRKANGSAMVKLSF